MILCREVIQFARSLNYFTDSRIAELCNLARLYIYEMIVLAALKGSFKLRNILPELMLYYKITVEQQFNSIV